MFRIATRMRKTRLCDAGRRRSSLLRFRRRSLRLRSRDKANQFLDRLRTSSRSRNHPRSFDFGRSDRRRCETTIPRSSSGGGSTLDRLRLQSSGGLLFLNRESLRFHLRLSFLQRVQNRAEELLHFDRRLRFRSEQTFEELGRFDRVIESGVEITGHSGRLRERVGCGG